MNCNLTNEERDKGYSCRSWDCKPCKEWKVSTKDLSMINIHMDNMRLREENEKLKLENSKIYSRRKLEEKLENQQKIIDMLIECVKNYELPIPNNKATECLNNLLIKEYTERGEK